MEDTTMPNNESESRPARRRSIPSRSLPGVLATAAASLALAPDAARATEPPRTPDQAFSERMAGNQ
ncbi:MAG: hypothetical protein CMJ52_00205 [Planctomycetaceae bacterium]|nr:hypothetical protein [Planctomycetaceae bacterium]